MSETMNPRQLAEQYIGQTVTLTFTDGTIRQGVLLGCGESGLTLASGIGGHMAYPYGRIDAISDEEPWRTR